MKINEVCKENRLELGLTIEEFSKSLDLKAEDYENFENGKKVFDEETVKKIMKALYVSKKDFEIEEFDDSEMDEEERRLTSISLRVIKSCEEGEEA